jgi:DNA polymerase (family 10)
VLTLWIALRVASASDLEHACHTNRVRDQEGLGKAVQAECLRALRGAAPWGGRRLLDAARRAAARVLGRLEREPSALRLAVAGDVRRMAPTVERVDLVASAHEPRALLDAFERMGVGEPRRPDDRTSEIVLEDGLRVRLEAAGSDAEALALLVLRTGSSRHVDALRRRATERGLSLDERGLRRGEEVVAVRGETDVYEALGVAWRPPERREDDDLDAPVPGDLVAMGDLRGAFHVHTDDGAGSFPLADMARRAAREGYAWTLLADRSPSAVPRGVAPGTYASQRERAAGLAGDGDAARVLVGSEVQVLADGRLDGDEATLRGLDAVIAVVDDPVDDDRRPQDRETLTARWVRAVAHPAVDVVSRPTGRVLLGREPAPVDVDRLLDACAEHGVAVEISGDPHVLELDEAWHEGARRRGIPAVLAADAHDLAGFDQAILAVGAARRGGWRRDEVLNTLEADAYLERRARRMR